MSRRARLLQDWVRPKVVAITVSGCHPIPVNCGVV